MKRVDQPTKNQALVYAVVRNKQLHIVKELVEKADDDAKNEALVEAVRYRQLNIVKKLVEKVEQLGKSKVWWKRSY